MSPLWEAFLPEPRGARFHRAILKRWSRHCDGQATIGTRCRRWEKPRGRRPSNSLGVPIAATSSKLLRPLPELEGNNGRQTKRDHRFRLAFIVSHPIQYYAPLYQRLARRDDIAIKIFFTWHAGTRAVHDRGFGVPNPVWDIPLAEGYDFELVKNISLDPGTHHFWGLRNPESGSPGSRLAARRRSHHWLGMGVASAGAEGVSRSQAAHAISRRFLHLLDEKMSGPRWWLKKNVLKQIYRWPTRFLVTGTANRTYYETFGVESRKLVDRPHSIDVARFAEPAAVYEEEARRWRAELGLSPRIRRCCCSRENLSRESGLWNS